MRSGNYLFKIKPVDNVIVVVKFTFLSSFLCSGDSVILHRRLGGAVAFEGVRIEVDPLVEMSQLNVASLLLVLVIGELTQPL